MTVTVGAVLVVLLSIIIIQVFFCSGCFTDTPVNITTESPLQVSVQLNINILGGFHARTIVLHDLGVISCTCLKKWFVT